MRVVSVLVLGLALSTAGPLWAPNCTKGKPCGNSCIPMSSTCHIGESSGGGSPAYSGSDSAPSTLYVAPARPQAGCVASADELNLAAQTLLHALGYRSTPGTARVDGASVSALTRYQRDRRMPLKDEADGAVVVALALDAAQKMGGKR